MQKYINGYRLIGVAFVIAALSFAAFADTIRLKDGSIIKGRIVSFGGGKFVVNIGEGTRRKELSFASAEVESIQFDQTLASADAPRNPSQPVLNANYYPDPQAAKPAPKVITTDSIKQPAKADAPAERTTSRTDPVGKTSTPGIKPVEIAVKVMADNTANGWTNSGWVVKKGQKIRISGEGEISLGGGRKSDPSGISELEDTGKLLKSVPTGALIAVVGDDNNDFIYIGSSREFTATRDGSLFLGVNEGNLNDNSGTYNVKVEIQPDLGR